MEKVMARATFISTLPKLNHAATIIASVSSIVKVSLTYLKHNQLKLNQDSDKLARGLFYTRCKKRSRTSGVWKPRPKITQTAHCE